MIKSEENRSTAPDLVISGLDEAEIGLMAVRLVQLRGRLDGLEALDCSFTKQSVRRKRLPAWRWHDVRRGILTVQRLNEGELLLSNGIGRENSAFSFSDSVGVVDAPRARPLDPFVDADESGLENEGPATVLATLDGMDAALRAPRTGSDPIRRELARVVGDPGWIPPLAAEYVASIRDAIERFRAILIAYGDPDGAPTLLRTTPPTPGDAAVLQDDLTGRAVLTPKGISAVFADVPKAVWLTQSSTHGYVFTGLPDPYRIRLPELDAMGHLRTAGRLPSGASKDMLAPRLRR